MTDNILAITEAYCVYNILDNESKSKIPDEVVEYLENNKDLNLDVQISSKYPLYMQEISEDGWALIAYLGTFLA